MLAGGVTPNGWSFRSCEQTFRASIREEYAHWQQGSSVSSKVKAVADRKAEPQPLAASTEKLLSLSLQFNCLYDIRFVMDARSDKSRSARASALAAELRALVGKLKRRMREQADVGDLTPSQVSVLLRLEKDGQATTSSLARAEGMRPQSMATIITALESAGLVSGVADPADGRRTLLSLTDACRRWVQEGRAARQDWLARRLQARLSIDEMEVVATAAALLNRLVDD